MTAASIPPRPGLHPDPSQKPAQAGATPGVVGMVLPCPFCGAPPRVVTVPSGKFYGCQTPTCLAQGGLHPIEAWNTRTLLAASAEGNERILAKCIANALRDVCDDMGHRGGSGRLGSAILYLRQALNVLRPPAAPVSVAFWLGSDAS